MLRTRTAFAALALVSIVASGCDLMDQEAIGPDGGVVVSADGRMALEVPAGALEEAVDIRIEVLEGPDGSASNLYVVEPAGLVFEQPAVLTFDYDPTTLGGHAPEALAMMTHRSLGWDYLGDQLVDDDDQTLSASVLALSPVTIVVEP